MKSSVDNTIKTLLILNNAEFIALCLDGTQYLAKPFQLVYQSCNVVSEFQVMAIN